MRTTATLWLIWALVVAGCSDDETTASGTTTGAGSGGGSTGSTSTGGGGAGGGDGGAGGGGPAARGVWPGTTTRFFPGIYFVAGRNPTPDRFTTVFDQGFAAHDDGERWRDEDDAGHKITYVGCAAWVNVEQFYVDPTEAPADYGTICARSSTAADPDWSNYDWSYLENLLAADPIANGGAKLFLAIDDTFGNPLPTWMIDQEMDFLTERRAALWRQRTTFALMDFLEAFATRFAGDDRIAAVMLTETYAGGGTMPADYDSGASACGNVDGLSGIDAMRQGRIYEAVALKSGDPDQLVMVMNLVPAMHTGYGTGSPGMNDLPGQWGALVNGARFFGGTCGSGTAGEVDCTELPHSGFWSQQSFGLTGSHAAGVDTQSNEWEFSDDGCCRLGDANPWGVDPWPTVTGYWPGQGGEWKEQPTPAQWVWYYGDEPKNAADDSGLGQSGRDPGGVSPVHYYLARVRPPPEIQASEADDTSADTRTYDAFAEAFETFGPPGTGAMFRYPDGYR